MEKPKINFITFYRTEGNYNLFNVNDVSAQYVVTGVDLDIAKENNLRLSYTFNIEYDWNFNPDNYTVLELLNELEYIYNKHYLFSTSVDDMKRLREYLESIEGEQSKLRHQYQVDYAKYQIEYWTEELNKLKMGR